MKFVVAQLGARMHYAVPRIFAEAGHLDMFFTDISIPKSVAGALSQLPGFLNRGSLRRLSTRQVSNVPPRRVRSMPWFGLDYWRRLQRAHTQSDQTATYLWGGREFCKLILRHGLGSCDSIYTFNCAGLELLRFAKQNGLCAIMEQTIAPKFVERELLEEESALWPNWDAEDQHDTNALEFAARERDEWRLADLVLCGSEFVAEGVRQSASADVATRVVPYGVDTPVRPPRLKPRGRALRVLFCGAVGLRKGVPYVLQAANRLLSSRFEFRVVGPVHLAAAALRDLQSAAEVLGGVPRSEIWKHYEWADVFVLPSLCEGSATVCYEALASGLPVITTPNAGSIVRDGREGFIVPIRDADAIAERLERMAAQPGLLDRLSEQARRRAADFTVAKYGERLISTIHDGILSHC